MEIFGVIAELGFTITAVLGGGVFIVILLKYILGALLFPVINQSNLIDWRMNA